MALRICFSFCRQISVCNFMQNLSVNDFSKLAMSHQFHVIRMIYKGGLTHLLLFLSTNILMEFYAIGDGQRFLETGDVSRHGTNSMRLGGSIRVALRIFLYFCRQISVCNFMQKLRVNDFSKLAMSHQFHVIRRIYKGDITYSLFFMSSNICL